MFELRLASKTNPFVQIHKKL